MPPSDFSQALARAYDLLGELPRHHPEVRVALAEAMSLRPADEAVEVQGISGTLLGRTLARLGVIRVVVEAAAEPADIEGLLERVRAVAAGNPRSLAPPGVHLESRDGEDAGRALVRSGAGGAPPLARSVAALFPDSGFAPPAASTPVARVEEHVSPDPPGTNGRPDAGAVPSSPGASASGSLPPTGTDTGPSPTGALARAVTEFAAGPSRERRGRVLELAREEASDPPDRILDAVTRLVLAADGLKDDPRLRLARELAGPSVLARVTSRLAAETDRHERSRLIRVALALEAPMAWALAGALTEARDPDTRRLYLDCLVAFGPSGLQPAEEMIRDARWFVARNGVRLLPDVAGRSAVDTLASTLGHDDPRVRRESILGLTRIGGAAAARLLAGMVGDPDADVRSAAARGLGILGGVRAARVLLDQLEVEEVEAVQADLVTALGRTRAPEAVPALERRARATFFNRAAPGVRVAAVHALWGMGTSRSRSTVVLAAVDQDPQVQAAVRTLLGRGAPTPERTPFGIRPGNGPPP